MNKNKFIYILIMVIALFGFKSNVYAAQELSCLYEKKGENNSHSGSIYKVLLVQRKDGTKFVYKTKNDETFDSDKWEDYSTIYRNKFTYATDKSSKKQSLFDIELTECPQSKTTEKFWEEGGTGAVIFYANEDGEDQIEDSKNIIENYYNETETNQDVNEDSIGIGVSCDSIKDEDKWLAELDKDNYVGACLYQGRTKYGCHIIQLNMSLTNVDVFDSFSLKTIGNKNSAFQYKSMPNMTTLTPDAIKSGAEDDGCPQALKVKITRKGIQDLKYYEGVIGYGSQTSGEMYNKIAVDGKNMFNGKELTNEVNVDIGFVKNPAIESCDDLFKDSPELKSMLKSAINVIKIGIPIVLIALGSLDFATAVFAGSEDKMKKAQSKFIKRIIIAVVIFLIPFVLKLLLTMAHGIWGNISTDLCGLI